MRKRHAIDKPRAPEAVQWEQYERAMWAVGLDYYRARISALPCRGHRMLDLGCGPGQWCAAALHEGMSVVGCDKRITARAVTLSCLGAPFSLVEADAAVLPFADASFDLVLCHLLLPYVAVEASVIEIARVLEPGGIFNGVCHGPGYYLMRAWREARKVPRSAIRPLVVLAYTVVHRMVGLATYHYETFQSPNRFRTLLEHSGFEVLSLELGGHPTIPEIRFARLPVFFEFVARKSQVSPVHSER